LSRFFQVPLVFIFFLLFWRGDSGLVFILFCEKCLPFLHLRFGRGNHFPVDRKGLPLSSGSKIPPQTW
jgi:hypothetical protein